MEGSAIMVTREKAGLSRRYYYPYPLDAEIPTIEDLKKNPEHTFITCVPGNAEAVVWKTRQRLNQENHRSYIYAMVMYAMSEDYNPSDSSSWQFRHNLRKLKNKLKNRNIVVTMDEQCAIHYMENMDFLEKDSRIEGLKSNAENLERQK